MRSWTSHPDFLSVPSPGEIGIVAMAVLAEIWLRANAMLVRALLRVR